MLSQSGSLVEAGAQVADLDDFDDFVAARGRSLIRLAYVLTGDAADAEDAVQDALARALPRWDKIRATADPDAYLRRMVVNANVSRWRRFRRQETPFADVVPHGTVADPADTALSGAENRRLWSAVLALPRSQRVAVALRFHEGLSYAEIADVTDCREATARSHVFRGLAALRHSLKGER
jgi:RNA polymerase sigma-70 factor (sigma-E family)